MADKNMNFASGSGGFGSARLAKNIATLTFPASESKLNMGIIFKFIQYQSSFGTGTVKSVLVRNIGQGHIALPLPEAIGEDLAINYETTDLGTAAQGAKAGLKSQESLNKFITSGEGGSLADSAGYVIRSLAQAAGSVGAVVNIAAGNIPNPYTTVLFKGVQIRTHSLTFKLVPETPEDSKAIVNIIRTFRLKALPEGGTFLSMPDECEVEYFGTNALMGFARCVVTSVRVNYLPSNSPSFFKNSPGGLIGAPHSVELTIGLSEVEQLTRISFNPQPLAPPQQKLPDAARKPFGNPIGNSLSARPANTSANVLAALDKPIIKAVPQVPAISAIPAAAKVVVGTTTTTNFGRTLYGYNSTNYEAEIRAAEVALPAGNTGNRRTIAENKVLADIITGKTPLKGGASFDPSANPTSAEQRSATLGGQGF